MTSGPTTSLTDQNKQVVAQWLDIAFSKPHEIQKSQQLISPQHELSLREIELSWGVIHAQFKNIKTEILDQVAEGEKVFTRVKIEADIVSRAGGGGGRRIWEGFYLHRVVSGAIAGGTCPTGGIM